MPSIKLELKRGSATGGLHVAITLDRKARTVKDSFDLASRTLNLTLPRTSPIEDDCWRRAGGIVAGFVRTLKCTTVTLVPAGLTKVQAWEIIEGLAISTAAGAWSQKRKATVHDVQVHIPQRLWDVQAVGKVLALRDALEAARWLVTAPPNHQGPEQLAQQAQTLLQDLPSVHVAVYADDWLQAERFNLLRAVASGGRPPVLIHAHYKPAQSRKKIPRIVLVGKGVTFDSGGLDIKPPASMLEMKHDMAGAAAVLSILRYAAARSLQVEIHALAPAVENLVDSSSMRPSDVYVARNGVSVEITNTDAEGRLILADTLVWSADTLNADATLDIATLTGAATMVGGWHTILVGKESALKAQILDAAMHSGERAIALPLWSEYDRELRSDIADWKNSTNTRNAGTISGGAFLAKFAPTNWVHLDIAPNAWASTRRDYLPLGATGAGVRTLARWLESLAAGR